MAESFPDPNASAKAKIMRRALTSVVNNLTPLNGEIGFELDAEAYCIRPRFGDGKTLGGIKLALLDDVETLETAHNSFSTATNATLESHATNLGELNSSAASAATAIAGLTTGLGDLETAQAATENTLGDFETRISANESGLGELQTDTTALEAYQRAMYKAMSHDNIILNGEFKVDQDGQGVVSLPLLAYKYVTDGIGCYGTAADAFTMERVNNPGHFDDFDNYIEITTASTGQTLDAGSIFFASLPVEGLKAGSLHWGEATSRPLMLNFVVENSVAGTFGGTIRNGAGNYCYPFSFTIPAANTPTNVSVIIPAPDGGTWPTDNTGGMSLVLSMGCGSGYESPVNVWVSGNKLSPPSVDQQVTIANNVFRITGIQMYPIDDVDNPVVRPYQQKNYDEYLWDCQKWACWLKRTEATTRGIQYNSNYVYETLDLPRAMPKFNGIVVANAPEVWCWNVGAYYTSPGTVAVDKDSPRTLRANLTVSGGANGYTAGLCNYEIFVDGRM